MQVGQMSRSREPVPRGLAAAGLLTTCVVVGFYLHWVTRSDTYPASWQIALESARGEDWEFHPGTATSFLLRLLRGQEPSKYPDYLQNAEKHFFTPAR